MNRRTILYILSPFIFVFVLIILLIGLLQSFGLLSINVAASLREIGTSPELARQAQQITDTLTRLSLLFRILFVPVAFIIALILHRLDWRIAGWLLDSPITNAVRRPSAVLSADATPKEPQPTSTYRPQHRQTLHHLTASLISLVAFGTAVLLTMLQFINSAGLALIATVASTALGFGARDYINDLIMGISDIFEDNFDVGEKVEVLRVVGDLQGVIEKVNVRTALLLTPDGIPITIPHGEMRVLRNFSRGAYSSTSVSFKVPAQTLDQTLAALNNLSADSMNLFPELVEPLKVVSRKGFVGAHTELMVTAKALYGQGADLRLSLLTTIEDRLDNLLALTDTQT